MTKKIKYCKAWVETNKARCTKKAMWGTVYCWSHYPKRAFIIESIITFILTLILSKMLLPKLWPFYYFLDKDPPIIAEVIPDLNRIKTVAKETESFDVLFHEKDSGIDLPKSDIKVSFKDENTYKSLGGELDKTNSNLRFTLDKELKYGEYLFEAFLVDKANNQLKFERPFVIKENEVFKFIVRCYKYADYENKGRFDSFFKNVNMDFTEEEFFVYEFDINNVTSGVILKDIYFIIDTQSILIIYNCDEIGHFNRGELETSGFVEAANKRKGRIFSGQQVLNINELAPYGFVRLILLAGYDRSIANSMRIKKVSTNLSIWGTYSYNGYGFDEMKRIDCKIPLIEDGKTVSKICK